MSQICIAVRIWFQLGGTDFSDNEKIIMKLVLCVNMDKFQRIGKVVRLYQKEGLLGLLLGECTDELEALAADEKGEESAAGRIRKRIEEI